MSWSKLVVGTLVASISLGLIPNGFELGPQSAGAQGRTQEGAVLGGITGAIAGGIIGHQNDETPEGAILGGVVGAVAGGLLGNAKDEQAYRRQQYHSRMVYQQQQATLRAVSNADVINMTRSGLSDSVIINHIQTNGVQRRLDTHDIIVLHQNGVREPVIQAMQQLGQGTAVAVAPREVVVPAAPPTVVVHRQYHVVPRYVPRPPVRVYYPARPRHHGWRGRPGF